ncbi:sensor histidine kinase [Geofilum rubicundum]|nr:histidine kinase [Geofilum rubicundum]
MKKKQTIYIQNDLQQKVLRAQMNPHFIFNVLGSIQSFMMLDESGKASDYLSRFASLIRSTLECSASESISLKLELEMLKNYVELEQMRMPEKFDYNIDIHNVEDAEFVFIPPMLVQPFVENAIKHGFGAIACKGKLSIEVFERKNSIEFVIADNGPGINGESKMGEGHRSMAMDIFNKRRSLIQHKLKREFGFKRENLNATKVGHTGLIVRLNIPVL